MTSIMKQCCSSELFVAYRKKWETSMLTFLPSFRFSILFSSITLLFLFCTHTNQSSPKAILHKVTAVCLNYPSLIVFPSFSDRHMFSWCIRNRGTYCLPSCSNWRLDNTSCSHNYFIWDLFYKCSYFILINTMWHMFEQAFWLFCMKYN